MLMEMWHTQKRYPRGETFYTQCTAVAVAVHCVQNRLSLA